MSLEKFKSVIEIILKQGALAIIKIIASKLIPVLETKYYRKLQDISDKIINRVIDRVNEILVETNHAKKIQKLYLLDLIKTTLKSIASSLDETVKYIDDNVDFSEINTPDENTLVALADIPGAFDDGCCGPDGCQIV